jgi:hypothetical protein
MNQMARAKRQSLVSLSRSLSDAGPPFFEGLLVFLSHDDIFRMSFSIPFVRATKDGCAVEAHLFSRRPSKGQERKHELGIPNLPTRDWFRGYCERTTAL